MRVANSLRLRIDIERFQLLRDFLAIRAGLQQLFRKAPQSKSKFLKTKDILAKDRLVRA